jgi:hypothetical protein
VSEENKKIHGNGNWHLRKEVTYGNMLSFAAIIVSMVLAWGTLQAEISTFRSHVESTGHLNTDARLDQVEQELARLGVIDAAMATRFDSLQREIINRLDRIEDRLNSHDGNP